MKNEVNFLIRFISIFVILLLIGIIVFHNSHKISPLLYEKYGEKFIIIYDFGDEYEVGLFPTFKKTGYKNVIAALKNNTEIKFAVRLKKKPLEIVSDDYISANIAYNTSREIETNYKIGDKIYVYTNADEYKSDGKITDSFFDNINGQGEIGIWIYVEGLDENFDYKEYLNGILRDLNFDSNTTGMITLDLIKKNGIKKINNYYKTSRDTKQIGCSSNRDFEEKYCIKDGRFYIRF